MVIHRPHLKWRTVCAEEVAWYDEKATVRKFKE